MHELHHFARHIAELQMAGDLPNNIVNVSLEEIRGLYAFTVEPGRDDIDWPESPWLSCSMAVFEEGFFDAYDCYVRNFVCPGIVVPLASQRDAESLDEPLNGPIQLRGLAQEPIVLGHRVQVLSETEYRLVEALIGAGDDGLNMQQLINAGGSSKSPDIFRGLCKREPWNLVLRTAGKSGGRYRIVRE